MRFGPGTQPRSTAASPCAAAGRAIARVVAIAALLVAAPAWIAGRLPQQGPPVGVAPTGETGQASVWYALGRVTTVAGAPLRGAKVAIFLDDAPNSIEHFETSYDGEFEVSLKAELNGRHRVRLFATMEGYLDGMEVVALRSDNKAEPLEIVLRDPEEDPDQLPLEGVVSAVSAHVLDYPGGAPAAPERTALLGQAKGLLAAHQADAASVLLEKALEKDPDCSEFRILLALSMLERGSWSGVVKMLSDTAANQNALEPGKRRPEPHFVRGVLECWRGNPDRGAELFVEGLKLEPNCPMLLQELGRAYLFERNWSGADASFAQAIQAGVSPEVHLLRAESLLALGKPSDARAEMASYLGGRKPKQLPTTARMVWIKLDGRLELETESQARVEKTVVEKSLAELVESVPELEGLEPAQSQSDLAAILQRTGERVENFFHDFHNTFSHEDVQQEILGRNGKVGATRRQSCQYLLTAAPDGLRPALDEYRTEARRTNPTSGAREQDFMLTKGFASTSAVLLPAYQSESTFILLGRQALDKRRAYVVAYAQRPEVARLQAAFEGDGAETVSLSQGIVWVDPETYQILRMRTDLLFPLVRARLDRESTDIRFSEVRFPEIPDGSWLPRDVVVTVQWKGKTLRNQHSYTNFRLFKSQARILETSPTVAGP